MTSYIIQLIAGPAAIVTGRTIYPTHQACMAAARDENARLHRDVYGRWYAQPGIKAICRGTK